MATSIISKPIISNGLVFCLDPLNSKSYSGGSIAYDMASNQPFSVDNGATYNKPSFVFDGVDDRLTDISNVLGNYFKLDVPFTIQVIFKIYSFDQVNFGTVLIGNSYYGNVVFSGLHIRVKELASEQIRFILIDSGTYIFCDSTSTINLNQYYMTTVTYDGSNTLSGLNIYLNGQLDNGVNGQSGTLVTISSTYSCEIGACSNESVGYFDGEISHICVYNRVLTTGEISYNYDALKNKLI